MLPAVQWTHLFSGQLKSPRESAPVDRQYNVHLCSQGHLRTGLLYVGGYQYVT